MNSVEVPQITVDPAQGRVTLTGSVGWTNVRDGVFLAREVTRYQIALPLAGTPFAPGFTGGPTIPGSTQALPGTAAITLGDPKTAAETDSATGLGIVLFAAPAAEVAAGFPSHGLLIQPFTRIFAPGQLDGDQTFQVVLSLDSAFQQLSAITVAMQVRTPVISPIFNSTDIFTTELFRGDNAFAPLALAAPAQGGPGDDRLVAAPGGATLDGQGGDDVLLGGVGDDSLAGGAGNDRLSGGAGDDKLAGGADNDVLRSNAGADTLDGGAGNDSLFGSSGNQILLGGDGADTLLASLGNDTLEGGAGTDRLRGDAGRDVFVFRAGFEQDRILDFADRLDRLDFRSHSGVSAFGDLAIRAVGSNVVIDDGAGGRIVLLDTALSSITASDFLF